MKRRTRAKLAFWLHAPASGQIASVLCCASMRGSAQSSQSKMSRTQRRCRCADSELTPGKDILDTNISPYPITSEATVDLARAHVHNSVFARFAVVGLLMVPVSMVSISWVGDVCFDITPCQLLRCG